MSDLPQTRRILVEDFPEQKKWIENLLTPLNNFMESTYLAFDRNLTIRQNMAADIRVVVVDRVPTATNYISVLWTLKSSPISVHLGRIQRADNNALVLANAIQIDWDFDRKLGLRLTNLIGITPDPDNRYNLTLVIFTG